jgi:hypothetical protein
MLVEYGKDGCQPRKEYAQGGDEGELDQSECCRFRKGVENSFRGGIRKGT